MRSLFFEYIFQPSQMAKLIHGRSFVDLARASLSKWLFFATEQVKDGFLALATAISSHNNVELGEMESATHAHRGTRALQVLGICKSYQSKMRALPWF